MRLRPAHNNSVLSFAHLTSSLPSHSTVSKTAISPPTSPTLRLLLSQSSKADASTLVSTTLLLKLLGRAEVVEEGVEERLTRTLGEEEEVGRVVGRPLGLRSFF